MSTIQLRVKLRGMKSDRLQVLVEGLRDMVQNEQRELGERFTFQCRRLAVARMILRQRGD